MTAMAMYSPLFFANGHASVVATAMSDAGAITLTAPAREYQH